METPQLLPLSPSPLPPTPPPLAAQVAQDKGKEFAEQLDIPFLETSAKAGTFVDTAFLMMAHEIKNKMMNVSGGSGTGGGLSSGGSEKKGCC